MLLTIQNENHKLRIDTLGAQLMGIQSADGTEYLWQGDPKYWADRSPLLFPFIGRLTNNTCSYHGQIYPMSIHGFAAASEFEIVETQADSVILELKSNDTTRRQYPFEFSLKLGYSLVNGTLQIKYTVENLDDKIMPFAIGGHPGFNVPLVSNEVFEDYTISFSQPCKADRIGFTESVFLSGHDEPYPLEDDIRLHLRHDLFDEDAIILKNMDREVTLRSNISGRGVRISYPGLPYLGIWHKPRTDAPYVCIEPWSSLPSRQDIVEELSCKSDLIHLTPGKTYETIWSITVL